MAFVLRPPDEVVPLNQRLRGLGRMRRVALVAAGVFTLVAVVGGLVAAAGVLDAWLHLSAGSRALLLAVTLAAAVGLYVRGVRRPARVATGPVAVAQVLEAKFPEFNDALASAVSFLERGGGHPSATQFRRAVVRRAERMAARRELGGIVPAGRAWRALFAALAVVLGLGLLIVSDAERAGVAAVRLFDPFGDHPWPPKTRVELTDPPTLLAKGDPYAVRFTVAGVVPPDAVLTVRLVGGSPADERIPLDPSPAVAVQLLPDRVSRDFEFRVVANDADTGWHAVTVAAPPRLVPLDGRPSPQVRLAYQPYTRQRPTDLPDGSGGIEAVAGTRVRLTAATDRPVVAATLRPEGELHGLPLARGLAAIASVNPFAAAASPSLSERFAADVPVAITADGQRLDADFIPARSGLYSLRFTDAAGLTGVQKLDVRTYPDPPPGVTLARPTPGSDALLLVPTAKLPLKTRAEDRTFGVRRLTLEWRVNDGPWQDRPLADAAGPVPQLDAERPFAVADFPHANGRAPADGDVVTLRTTATDWDDYTPAKPPGRSPEVEIRVLSEASLTALLQQQLAALRPELSRATATQKEAAARTEQAKAAATPDAQLAGLTQAEQLQRQLRGQLTDPRDGLRAKAEKLRDAAKANALPPSAVTQRAEAVARALGELEDKHLAEVEPQLAAAKAAADPKARAEATAKAAKAQQAAVEKLTAAAEELEQWAAAAEVRGDARQLQAQATKAADAARTAGERFLAGKPAEQLPAADQATLGKLGEALDKAAEQAGKLMSKADRVADEKRQQAADLKAAADKKAVEAKALPAGSPARADAEAKANDLNDAAAKAQAEADTLAKAAATAGRQAVADDLRQAAAAQRDNRTAAAAAAAERASARLEQMTADLAERKDAPDELRKKRKAAADRVDQLADRQDELAKKAAKADPEGLKKLAADEEALRRDAEELSRKLEREGTPEAAEQLRRAAEKMEQARDDLAAGRDPQANPDDALERLEAAKEKLEKDQPNEQQQLEREQREQSAEQFKALFEKQKAAVEESERLTAAAAKAKKWERPLQASLSALADREKALAKEARTAAETKADGAKVFERMLRQAAEQMDRAGGRLAERKADVVLADPAGFDAATEAAADEEARRPMRLALRRLEQIVNALKEDAKKSPAATKPMAGGESPTPMPMAGGGPQKPPGVSPVAQLKALRDWQQEVNDRTAAFAKAHPDQTMLTDDDRDELNEIEKAQKDITELLEELLPLLRPMPGGELP